MNEVERLKIIIKERVEDMNSDIEAYIQCEANMMKNLTLQRIVNLPSRAER